MARVSRYPPRVQERFDRFLRRLLGEEAGRVRMGGAIVLGRRQIQARLF